MVYGETAVYANEDLIKESGKFTSGTTFVPGGEFGV